MEQILPILIGAVALIAGIILGKILFAKNTKQLIEDCRTTSSKNNFRRTITS